jgi:hypothetical protein
MGCPFDEQTFIGAFHKPQILEWLLSEGCPWSENTFAAAAATGALHLLKWLRSNGCSWDEKTFLAVATSANGCNPKLMKWLKSEGCPGFNEASADAAVQRYYETMFRYNIPRTRLLRLH